MLKQSFEKILDLDQQVSNQLNQLSKNKPIRSTAAIFAHSGDSWFWLAGLLVVALFGSSNWRTTAIVMMAGIFITAGLVFLIKKTVRRQRPEGEWGEIYRKTDPHSFPSGHAARAVMLAIIAVGLGPPLFGWILVIWAPLVILARVIMGVHYLTDVIVGALIGSLSAVFILIIFQNLSFPI